jgi:orotate phosphoribosyltransferase
MGDKRVSGLFRLGDRILHSGTPSPFFIDCDALSDSDIEAPAARLRGFLPEYGPVEGVPRGGLRLAAALARDGIPGGPLLIVDDVLTTGGSMEEHRAGREAIGAVIFARGICPQWVVPLFTMAPATGDADG